jgi:hypothetical protein
MCLIVIIHDQNMMTVQIFEMEAPKGPLLICM